MRPPVQFVLLCMLLLVTASELRASIPKSGVRGFFFLAGSPKPEESLQVPKLRLDNPLLYGELTSGQQAWTKFDPEGLYGWSDFTNDADKYLAGILQGADESNGISSQENRGSTSQVYKAGIATGHLAGLIQGGIETGFGGGMTEAGSATVIAGGAATATGVGAEVGVPAMVGGAATAAAGAAVATHGSLVAANSTRLLFEDASSAGSSSGGSPEGEGAKDTQEESKDSVNDAKGADTSRTNWGAEHGTGNVEHNNWIEDTLDDASERGATDIRKNRVQRNAAGDKVFAPDGSFTKPDASYIENGMRYNENRVSDLNHLDRELDSFTKMILADPNATNSLEF